MELRPILSALLRNKTGAVLVGLQIALTLAVVANAAFIIVQRIERIHRPTGMDTDNLIFVETYGFGSAYDQRDTARRDLDVIRSTPGVVAASPINPVPLSGAGSMSSFLREPGPQRGVNANIYSIDEHGLEALGLKLIEGRAFNEQEIQYTSDPSASDFVPSVIITRDFAKALFGDEPALGKSVYDGLGRSAVVVGIVDHMLGWVHWDTPTRIMLQPRIASPPKLQYVVRAEPGMRDALIAELERKLADLNPNRAVTAVHPHDYYIEQTYRVDNRMVAFLSVIVVLMIAVTALGIVGLASFYVNVRRKQIGTRRAVGARRIDIIRYFMVENWLLTTGGSLIGAVLAFAFGQWLSSAFALPRLEPVYVAAGVVLLWILGLAAVFVPARRAAAIPPAVATRTV